MKCKCNKKMLFVGTEQLKNVLHKDSSVDVSINYYCENCGMLFKIIPVKMEYVRPPAL